MSCLTVMLMLSQLWILSGSEDLDVDDRGITFPSFKEATSNRSIAWGWWSENDMEWVALLESLYDAHLPVAGGVPRIEGAIKQVPSIKKIMHQVWLGGKPIPPQFAAWRNSCTEMHPDWLHILWTEKEADELEMLDRRAYDSAENIGAKSDALRCETTFSLQQRPR